MIFDGAAPGLQGRKTWMNGSRTKREGGFAYLFVRPGDRGGGWTSPSHSICACEENGKGCGVGWLMEGVEKNLALRRSESIYSKGLAALVVQVLPSCILRQWTLGGIDECAPLWRGCLYARPSSLITGTLVRTLKEKKGSCIFHRIH
ncbi:hypothetical protein CEXT_348871 [Caerostris extrusa]|uniref:Uncharacterized protein n=1 Tax=Caerostris extrusa TaxID=172846 RepID=A0AAV4XQQ9_CAEEX|nr:hypothetical protein CEXT_348871 [Caerostris extrusa]